MGFRLTGVKRNDRCADSRGVEVLQPVWDEQPATRSRARWRLVALVVIGALAIAAAGVLPGLAVAGPDTRNTLVVYVAAPPGSDFDALTADAALHEAELAIGWIEQQTGRRFRRGPGFAEIVEVTGSAESWLGDADDAYLRIHDAVTARVGPTVFPLVLADVTTDHERAPRRTCGIGGPDGIVLLLGNCAGDDLRRSAVWPSTASWTIAHELLHGLGAARDCAPHSTGDGHVDDDPWDILSADRPASAIGRAVTLDVGRDDYFGHGIPGCPDIADSPLWAD